MTRSAEIIKMVYKITVSIGAVNDTTEAYTFYENQQPGLGDRFLNELVEFYEKLKLHPTYYSFVSEEKTIRALALKIFPYRIIYEVEGDELYIFAIHHFRQNSRNFLKKL